jgi:hypothetical protein
MRFQNKVKFNLNKANFAKTMDAWSLSGYHKLPKDTTAMLKQVDEDILSRRKYTGREINNNDLNNTI